MSISVEEQYSLCLNLFQFKDMMKLKAQNGWSSTFFANYECVIRFICMAIYNLTCPIDVTFSQLADESHIPVHGCILSISANKHILKYMCPKVFRHFFCQ